MKSVLAFILLSITAMTSGQVVDSIKSVEYSYFAGECMGYCSVSRLYDKTTLVVRGEMFLGQSINPKLKNRQDSTFISRAIDSSGTETIEHPTDRSTIVTSKLKSGEWQKILTTINLADFYTLSAVTGCPDCTDGGAEYIEIICTHSSHKIAFEAGNYNSKIATLIPLIKPSWW